jgi:hypothetical protein
LEHRSVEESEEEEEDDDVIVVEPTPEARVSHFQMVVNPSNVCSYILAIPE